MSSGGRSNGLSKAKSRKRYFEVSPSEATRPSEVHGTIHCIAGYRRARNAGLDRSESLQETHKDIGRALLFATLALVIGFSVLALSHFLPLVHFGILVSFAMAGGLAADLLLFPVLLRMVEIG